MIYPINIFTLDPSGEVRPFIIFIAKEPQFNVAKVMPHAAAMDSDIVVGGFVLPFTNGGLVDAVTHDFGPVKNPLMGMAIDEVESSLGKMADVGRMATGMTADPHMTNIYQGTAPRTWSGTWQIIPQSTAESLAVAGIIWSIKKWGSPKKLNVGFMKQPHNWKIIFGNPAIEASMKFNTMALQSYSINYFAQGYASTYSDGMPKHIELTLTFSEFGIKYRSDWGG